MEISLCTVDIDQIKILLENNHFYTIQEMANILKNLDQALRIIQTSLVMLVTSLFGICIVLYKKKVKK